MYKEIAGIERKSMKKIKQKQSNLDSFIIIPGNNAE